MLGISNLQPPSHLACSTSNFVPSHLFIYYNARVTWNDTKIDSGSTIWQTVNTIINYGACPESEWPYNDNTAGTNPVFTQQPSSQCYTDALNTTD